MGTLAAAFSSAIRSIRRLFGGGPIPVSRVPVPDAFDLEDSDTETDPFNTLRSTASRTWRSRQHNPASESSQSSAALDSEPDNGRGYDEDITNVVENGGVGDRDDRMGSGDEVLLISRDGEDFSLEGSVISVPSNRRPIEADRRSIEVVPPTPTLSSKQPFFQGAYHTRSASTPHLSTLAGDGSPIRPFSPSTNDLSSTRFRRPPGSPLISPKPILARLAASSKLPLSHPPDSALGTHHYTAATPPADSSGSSFHRSPDKGVSLASSSSPTPEPRSRRSPTDCSSPLSPPLQNYAPSLAGRSRPDLPYVPPGSVSTSPFHASDPQNLIPSAVRGAGYNPFQHAQ